VRGNLPPSINTTRAPEKISGALAYTCWINQDIYPSGLHPVFLKCTLKISIEVFGTKLNWVLA
jgi:hypothetical protein